MMGQQLARTMNCVSHLSRIRQQNKSKKDTRVFLDRIL
jgi:hypothetical protein